MQNALGTWSPLLSAGVVIIFLKLLLDSTSKTIHEGIKANTEAINTLRKEMKEESRATRGEIDEVRAIAREAENKANKAVDAQALSNRTRAATFVRREDITSNPVIAGLAERCRCTAKGVPYARST